MSLIVKKKEIALQDCGGDESKKWLIRYYTLVNGKPTRQREVIRSSLSKEERYAFAKARIAYLAQFTDEKGHVALPCEENKQEKVNNNKLINMLNQCIASKRNVLERESCKLYPPLIRYLSNFLGEKSKFTLTEAYQFRNYLFELKVQDSNKPKGTMISLSKKRINNYLSALRELFTEAVRLGLMKENPMQSFKNVAYETQTQEIYPKADMKRVFEFLQQEDRCLLLFVKFLFYTCNRPNAIRYLKVGDIDLVNRTITFEQRRQKNSKRLVQSISDAFYEDLKVLGLESYPPEYYIFGYRGLPDAKVCHKDYFRKRHRKMLEVLNIDKDKYKLYNWKHTGASLLFVALDYDILRIKRHLGHSDVKATMSYISKYHELSEDDKLIKKAPKFGA